MDKQSKERELGFINYTCGELHSLVNDFYESYFDKDGNPVGVGDNLNNSLFDLKLFVDDLINQVNDA